MPTFRRTCGSTITIRASCATTVGRDSTARIAWPSTPAQSTSAWRTSSATSARRSSSTGTGSPSWARVIFSVTPHQKEICSVLHFRQDCPASGVNTGASDPSPVALLGCEEGEIDPAPSPVLGLKGVGNVGTSITDIYFTGQPFLWWRGDAKKRWLTSCSKVKLCCGSKYIEFGSGSRILAQFGFGSRVIQ